MAALKNAQAPAPPQGSYPQPQVTPSTGGPQAAGLVPPRAVGAPGAQLAQAQPDPRLAATSTAAIEANVRQADEVSRSLASTKIYLARRNFSVLGDMSQHAPPHL